MTTCVPGQETATTTVARTSGSTPSKIPTFTMLPEPVTGYPLYDCERDDTAGFYLVKPKAANNLVNNPTFYLDLSSWTAFNAKMLRTNEWAFDSGFSVRVSGSGDIVTAERREYIQSEVTDFDIDRTYVFSSYAFLPQVWDVADPYTGTISIVFADALNNETEIYSEKLTTRNKWIRLSVSGRVPDTTDRMYIRLNLRSQDQQEIQPPYDPTGLFNRPEEYIYFDALQFEDGLDPTTFFHGDTQVCEECNTGCSNSAYRWYGEPHNSPSHRSRCARDGGELVCLSEEFGFQMLSHTGHGMPPVRDISYPLANRPGELYQKTAIDARVLTFTGAVCESTLHELECAIFGLQENILPDTCYCDGKFLLVYSHENCNNRLCDPERHLALCVSYIGGLEGFRDNLFQQRLTLQFKAHDPMWFLWPGHSSQALNMQNFVRSPNVVQIGENGEVISLPINQGLDIRTAACLGSGGLVIGGSFDKINETECSPNLAVWDCNEFCDTGVNLFSSGAVTTSITDSNGNVIVGGEFTGGIRILYADGNYGSFPNYPGSAPNALAAPFWAQIVVATDEGVYINTNDGNWYLHATDGPVYDVEIAVNGDIIAVGDFTSINGISSLRIARYNVFDSGGAFWESSDVGFDAAVRSVAVDPDSGDIFVGGDFLNTVATGEDTCIVLEQSAQTSTCASQYIRITQSSGSVYTLTLGMGNIITREIINNCFNEANKLLRVTATNSCGATYNFLFGTNNASITGTATETDENDDKLYTINFDIDTGIGLTLGDCETSNQALVNEFSDSNESLVFLAPLELPGEEAGFDNTVGSFEINCISLTTSTTPDSTEVKHIAKVVAGVVSALDQGVDMVPTTMFVHPITGELWVGGISDGVEDGLLIWNGMNFRTFGDLGIGDEVDVLSMNYCPSDCSVSIVYDGSSPVSAMPGFTPINYYGSQAVYPELIFHGPGSIECVENGAGAKWIGCLSVSCGEVVSFNFNNGSVSSNFRQNLGKFAYAGASMNLCLSPRCDNSFKICANGLDADSRATLVWRDRHAGIEALCCAEKPQPPATNFYQDCCPTISYTDSGCPDDSYCLDNGYPAGSIIIDYSCACPSVYISIDDTCPGEDCYYTDGCGCGITDENGDCLCPDPIETECD